MTITVDLKEVPQWRIISSIVIKETHSFTRIIQEIMPDDLYAELQRAIIRQPDLGNIIQGSGGLRKLRWKLSGSGKRGGVRVIYYWMSQENEIYMLFAYAKAKCEDLTREQVSLLRKVVEEELKNG